MPATSLGVCGLYSAVDKAEQALDNLTRDRFVSDDVSVLMQDVPLVRRTAGTLGLLDGLRAIETTDAGSILAAGPITRFFEDESSDVRKFNLPNHLMNFGLSGDASRHVTRRLSEGAVILFVQCRDATDRERASDALAGSGVDEIMPIANPNAGHL